MLGTRKMDYGLSIMMTLGKRAGERLSGEELGEAAQVSRGFALKVVRQLAQAGLVLARRGVGGGVDLARPIEDITLHDILSASGSIRTIDLCVSEPKACDSSAACAAHRLLRPVQKTLEKELSAITLAKLVKEQQRIDAKRANA
ncbi:Rrf2 family transcriptional regulator [bacterium]|nr:Rrf2 family transcriptional regulator [bacterium]